MGLIYARHTLQISRQVYMYKYVIVSTDSFFSTNLKQLGYIKEAFSVDDTKNDNISLILCQVVAVNKYYPVLPAVPKNSSERRKTVLRAAQ